MKSKPRKSRPLKRKPVKPIVSNKLAVLLEELNKFYGASFECTDFDRLYELFIRCYMAGKSNGNAL